MFSCGTNRNIRSGEELLSYQSAGNGVANIYLGLYENHRFIFEVKPVSTKIGEKARRKEIGTYTEVENAYILEFPKKSNFELQALFDDELDDAYEILDDQRVKIQKDSKLFYLWGILIEKHKANTEKK